MHSVSHSAALTTTSPATTQSLGTSGIAARVRNRERIGEEEAARLFDCELEVLAAIGAQAREQRHGRAAFYIINRHINYSNLCVLDCAFCAFGKRRRDPGAYELSIEEMTARARMAESMHATEIHVVGGLHPTWKFSHYLEMLRALRAVSPRLTLKCFTAIEILHFSWIAKLSVAEVLSELRDAGLDCMTGGGAEIFAPRVRKQICRGKETAEEWLDVHRTAHRLGIRSTATMLFGHVETYADRIDHMRRLRELQDETGGFIAFLPLAFRPAHRLAHLPEPHETETLKTIAVARAYLDNFDHIKSYWISYGLKLAQRSLAFGADDLDGTIEEERIYHMAGCVQPIAQTVDALRTAIADAGLTPILRDSFYRPLAA